LPQPCDVAIIGGGFTGLSAAITIKRYRPRWHVLVLESEAMGTLASSRNAGFLCLGSPTELMRDIETHGSAVVEDVLRCKITGASILLDYLKKTKLIYAKSVGYEYFSSEIPEPDNLDDHLNSLNGLMRAAGGSAGYFVRQNHAPNAYSAGVPTSSWVRMNWEGQIHPAAAVARLRLQFQNLGGVMSFCHKIESLQANAYGVDLHSDLGTIRARQVLVANNAFVTELLPDVVVEAQRAQVLITEPLGKLPFRGNVHFRQGYMYCRDVGQRFLIGGGRFLDFEAEHTHQLGTTDVIQNYLIKQLSVLSGIPGDELKVADCWSGIMGFTPGRLHPILEVKNQGMLVVAAGMNGMGTAMGPYMGKRAAELLIQEREGRSINLPQRGYIPNSPQINRSADKKKAGKKKGT